MTPTELDALSTPDLLALLRAGLNVLDRRFSLSFLAAETYQDMDTPYIASLCMSGASTFLEAAAQTDIRRARRALQTAVGYATVAQETLEGK